MTIKGYHRSYFSTLNLKENLKTSHPNLFSKILSDAFSTRYSILYSGSSLNVFNTRL